MSSFPKELDELIEHLSRFPGVGKRSAERIAFYILKLSQKESSDLSRKILDVHSHIKPCELCNNFSSQSICSICSNPKRDTHIVCVVEEPKDILAIEKTSQYKGLYYVLLGSISPLEGFGPDSLSIRKLISRVEKQEVTEVIISTDADNEGELTAQFLIEKLSPYQVKIYRIGIGVPQGAQIEYIDSATLGRALLERKPIL
ncbi:MAG: recombination protein RecR [Candidatus Omnitrophica bacterium]|nr:recombination protein RecR [Candidatus Omnitrophota bacterium]